MIETPTVFVLGAGASFLLTEYIKNVTVKFSLINEAGFAFQMWFPS
jgi:hypothetical protein